MFIIMLTSLSIFSVLQIQLVVLTILTIKAMVTCSSKICYGYITSQIVLCIIFNIVQPVLCWLFLFLKLDDSEARSLCSILLFTSGCHSLILLSKLPTIGVQTVMMARVAMSVFSFFKAFLTLFLSFCLTFHVLLNHTQAFGSLENAFIKVLAMLMGEFDFTTNFINAPNTPFLAKLFFLFFILIMALVFMNLLLGLAVSDIGELERLSKVGFSFASYQTIAPR